MDFTIFHLSHVDLDGYGCHLVSTELSRMVKDKNVEVILYNTNYGGEIKEKLKKMFDDMNSCTSKDKMVLISDINLPMDVADLLEESRKSLGFELILLDHHITGEDVSKKYEWYHLDTGWSGTYLTYNYLVNRLLDGNKKDTSDLERMVNIINSYDLWKNDTREFKVGNLISYYMNDILRIYSRDVYDSEASDAILFYLRKIKNGFKSEYDHIVGFLESKYNEQGIINVFMSSIDEMLDAASSRAIKDTCSLKSMDYDSFTLHGCISITKSNRIAKDIEDNNPNVFVLENINGNYKLVVLFSKESLPSYTLNKFLLNYNYDGIVLVNPYGFCSLRSVGEFDVSKIATALGGGGHKNAAGFVFEERKVSLDNFESLVKKIQKEATSCN